MFVLLDGRTTDLYALQELDIIEDVDNSEWKVVSGRLAEDRNVLASFTEKVDAESYIKRAQDEITAIENLQFIDLRTDDPEE